MLWLAAFVGLLILTWALRKLSPKLNGSLEKVTEPVASVPVSGGQEVLGWLFGGLLFLTLSVVLLETRQPYYFTQDDALVTELPAMVYGCHQLWSGEFPDYNPFTSMGAPMAASGGCSFTYPPTLIAYAIARHILRDPYALLEVFAILHLLAGFLLTYLTGRHLRLPPALATVASLSFVLSGSILIMGRSWHMVSPILVILPLLMLSILRLAKGPVSWPWIVGTGLTVGLYYQVGFPQMWVYVVLFFGLGVSWLLITRRIPFRRALCCIPALLLGLGLVAPILFVQMDVARDIVRPTSYGNGILPGLKAMFLPYPLVRALHPNIWGSSDIQYMGHFYYFGTILLLAFILGILAIASRWPVRWEGDLTLISFLAIFAFLLALGRRGGLWFLLSKLPFMGAMNNHPFRALPFFVFFCVLGGGLTLAGLLPRGPHFRTAQTLVVLAALPLLLYHVTLALPSFYSYGFTPYPLLPAALRTVLKPGDFQQGRILSLAPPRSVDPSFPSAIVHSLPLVYGVPAFTGYDPLTESKPPYRLAGTLLRENTPAALRAYGIRWIVKHRTVDSPVLSPNPMELGMESLVRLRPVLSFLPGLPILKHIKTPEVEAWQVASADPLAFLAAKPEVALAIKVRGRGLDIQVPGGSSGTVVVNFLYYPQMKATLGGRPIPCGRDAWGRIVATVDASGGLLAVRFSPPWRLGIWNGVMLLILGVLLGLLLRIKYPEPDE